MPSKPLPVPRPSRKRKADIFNQRQFEHIDEHALRAPRSLLYRSFHHLVDYLIQPSDSPLARLRALFMWAVTAADADIQDGDVKAAPMGSPQAFLMKIKGRSANYAQLLQALCKEVDLPCNCIQGIAKSSRYQLGKEIDSSRLRTEWNAVLLDAEWRLLDVLWASTDMVRRKDAAAGLEPDDHTASRHDVNEFFFLTDPDQMIYTHLPDDTRWQLLPNKVSLKDFERFPFLCDRFFQLGVLLNDESHDTCWIETADGQVYIQLGLDPKLSKSAEFRYMIHKGKETKLKDTEVNDDTNDSTGSPKQEGQSEKDYIKMTRQPEELRLVADLPTPGRYKLDIFGKDPKEKCFKRFDLLCSYLLIYQQDGLSFLEIHFMFPVPSEQARYMRRGGASEWLKRKDAVLKVMGNEMIVSFTMPKGATNARRFMRNFENRNRAVPQIVRALLQNIPNELNLREAHDVKSPTGTWNLGSSISIQFRGHYNGLVRTPDGAAVIKLYMSKDAQLWYDIHERDRLRTVPVDAVNLKVSTKSDPVLVTFNLSLKKPGDYHLNVFTRDKAEPNKIFHVKAYLVQYELLEFV